MNVYDAIRDYLLNSMYSELGNDSRLILGKLLIAYDALAPTPEMWAQYPWAQWYTIDANGASIFSADEPFVPTFSERPNAFWDVNGKLHIGQRSILLPLGIDWRLCKWQRPEVTA